jgi:hypothetical protein
MLGDTLDDEALQEVVASQLDQHNKKGDGLISMKVC